MLILCKQHGNFMQHKSGFFLVWPYSQLSYNSFKLQINTYLAKNRVKRYIHFNPAPNYTVVPFFHLGHYHLNLSLYCFRYLIYMYTYTYTILGILNAMVKSTAGRARKAFTLFNFKLVDRPWHILIGSQHQGEFWKCRSLVLSQILTLNFSAWHVKFILISVFISQL